jgi:hypothetical protein
MKQRSTARRRRAEDQSWQNRASFLGHINTVRVRSLISTVMGTLWSMLLQGPLMPEPIISGMMPLTLFPALGFFLVAVQLRFR